MKDIYSGILKNLGTYTRQVRWFDFRRCYEMSFLIFLLVFNLQIISFAADDSNQPAQRKALKPEDFPKGWPETRKVIKSDLPIEVRINRIIQILDKEPVELSLNRLDEYSMYTWGGVWIEYEKSTWSGEKEIPLKPGVCRADLIAIMANRRFLKLIEKLSLLPKAKAADLVSKEIMSALSQYTKLWDEQMEYSEFLKRKPYKTPGKPTRALALWREDGKPTLVAVRLKVLALLLLAGNLQLEGTQPAVTKVLQAGIGQRTMFYENPIFDKGACAPMLVWTGLYQRQILGTAVLGTYVDSAKQKEILKQFGCKLKSEKLTRYNSAVTRYGPRHRRDFVPVDYSKGELTVKYLEPLNDSKFDDIVNAATEARKQITMPTEPKE